MVITYHGAEFIKITFGDTTLACNPIGKESKLKQTRFGADIVLQTLNHPDTNGAEQLALGAKAPFVIDGAGEYGIKDVLVKGHASKSMYGGRQQTNTVYAFSLENMTLLYLGALAEPKLPSALRQQIDSIDVLFVPIGGEGVMSPDEAHSLVVELEPRVIIPIHHAGVGAKGALDQFLKEESNENGAAVDKLVLKRKDLEQYENSVVVLKS